MSAFEQSEFRIKRAREKLTELNTLAGELREGHFQIEVPHSEDAPRQKYLAIYREALPGLLILISEIVLHLRAALDHVIFVLARIDSGSVQDGTQFPINDRKEFFANNRTACLKHLSDKHFAIVERFQPYHGTNLKLLNRLSNVDKHRQFIQLTIAGNFITQRMNLVRDDAEVAQAEPIIRSINAALRVMTMGMYRYVAPDILLDNGVPVCKALEILHSEVSNIVREFDAVLK